MDVMSLASRCVIAAVLAPALMACSGDPAAGEPEPPPGPPEPFTVMTFNVLCSFCGEGGYDPWDTRLGYFEDLFSRHDPDLLGLQELTFAFEVDQLLELRPGYAAVYYRRSDGAFSYPDATVLYRAARFELLGHGFYWLSPTPDVPSSTGFASQQLPRLVAWTHLRDRQSRRQLYFATTHFDNNPPSQQLSAPLVIERTAEWAQLPVLVVGDFNSQPDDEAYLTLTEGDGPVQLTNAQGSAASWSVETNQSPPPDYQLDERIDHIFVAPEQWVVQEWVVDLVLYGADGLYPSDHRAMVARLTAP